MWQSETRVIAVGHDCSPMLFETANGSDWHFSQSLDQDKKKEHFGQLSF
jgi:actin related protein 2/3 complex subunit 1A/1B